MPPETFEQLLDRAAAACGIEPGYWDIWGKHHATPAEVKRAILTAMGIPAGSPAELEAALAGRARREWERLLPPALVVSQSEPPAVPVNVSAEFLGERASATLRREDGGATALEANLWELQQTASFEMETRTFVRLLMPLPAGLPLGYHELELHIGSLAATTRYIVTPDHAWTHPHLGRGGRAAGISLTLYGIRSARNWGCGDFRDLTGVLDWVGRDLQAGFVGLNPLHAIHNRRPYNTSPYLPNCLFYQNFIYLDVEGMEDYAVCRRAQRLRYRSDICAEIESLREAPFVEYERVAALKLTFLKLLFAQFLREWRRLTPRAREFRSFVGAEGELLERFATYCALDEHLHKHNPQLWIWPEWPEEYRDPQSPGVDAFRKRHWRSVMFYQYLQWQIDVQLRRVQEYARGLRLGIGLYHDLALATDRFGSDLWAHRAFYVAGCRVGAPPDDFSPAGQDWGFPPPNSERHRENGYRLFVESIRRNCRHGGALRIDHVMRLFRLYWIPDELSAAQGAYVREQSQDYVRLLALESVRNRVMVVGEDLGTVEPEVRRALAGFGILSYRLFYFEQDEKGEFHRYEDYPSQALVSSTTHDLPTLAGFWTGADIEARRRAGVLDEAGFRKQLAARAVEKQKMLDLLFQEELMPAHLPRLAETYPELTGELHNAVVGFLALTPAQLLAINQEDLTKETEQQNLPGTTSQYPNWGRKMRFSVEQLHSDPQALAYTAMFRHWIAKTGRSNRGDL
ncbi:MAG: 4-alpha-glucanotransferase [Terriglobia bacterium]|nr:MAG: 4-alpha-glucanotransferase [Terriglobia bacterium]